MDSLHQTHGSSSLSVHRRERIARAEAFKAAILDYHEGRITAADLRAAFRDVEQVYSSPRRLQRHGRVGI